MAVPLPQILIPCSIAFTAYSAGFFVSSKRPWTVGRVATVGVGATFFVWMYPWIDTVQGMGLDGETTNVVLLGLVTFGVPSVLIALLLFWSTRSWWCAVAPLGGTVLASVAVLFASADNPLTALFLAAGLWHFPVAASLLRWSEMPGEAGSGAAEPEHAANDSET